MALSGETAIVGARYDDVGGLSNRGSAYVFVRNSGSWTQQDTLLAGDGAEGDEFGISVTVSDDTAVVAAGSDRHGTGAIQGSAYVFARSGGDWTQHAKLAAGNGSQFDNFGVSAAVSGSTAVVGGPGLSDVGPGLAYVYRLSTASDFGDAPDGYPTLLDDDGARHSLSGPKLGAAVDAESDGQPNSDATGDDIEGIDDEDGVQFGALTAGHSATVDVHVTDAPALLDAWIDFNGDGDWADAGEQIFDDYTLVAGANEGLVFQVPGTAATGISLARVRLSSAGVASFTGEAPDGEVEDEQVTLLDPPTGTVQLSGDSYSVDESEGRGTGTILNDDAAPSVPTLRIDDISVTEGAAGKTKAMTFSVTLSRTSTQTVTVNYGTANVLAAAPTDYTAKSGSLSFAPGTTSKSVSVTVKGDATREPNETFRVNLSSPSNSTIADGQGIGTIRNDD